MTGQAKLAIGMLVILFVGTLVLAATSTAKDLP